MARPSGLPSSFTTSRPSWRSPASTWKTCSWSRSSGAGVSGACCSRSWRALRSSVNAAGSSGPCSTGTARRSVSTSGWEPGPIPNGPFTASLVKPFPRLAENRLRMEVLHPKKLESHPGDSIVSWARGQLEIAREILDNPGGGLLFATQTIGQVSSALRERDLARWEDVIAVLDRVEYAAVHREFDTARTLLEDVLPKLS